MNKTITSHVKTQKLFKLLLRLKYAFNHNNLYNNKEKKELIIITKMQNNHPSC